MKEKERQMKYLNKHPDKIGIGFELTPQLQEGACAFLSNYKVGAITVIASADVLIGIISNSTISFH